MKLCRLLARQRLVPSRRSTSQSCPPRSNPETDHQKNYSSATLLMTLFRLQAVVESSNVCPTRWPTPPRRRPPFQAPPASSDRFWSRESERRLNDGAQCRASIRVLCRAQNLTSVLTLVSGS